MKDLIITINSSTRKVKLNKDFIGLCAENLQGNIIVDFEDEFVDGFACLEVVINKESFVISMERNLDDKIYLTPIKSNLLKTACNITCQVKITQSAVGTEVPVFRSEKFTLPCKESVCAETELPEDPQSWQEMIESKIADIQDACINIENKTYTPTDIQDFANFINENKEKIKEVFIGANLGNTTTITRNIFNGKDGTVTSTSITDYLILFGGMTCKVDRITSLAGVSIYLSCNMINQAEINSMANYFINVDYSTISKSGSLKVRCFKKTLTASYYEEILDIGEYADISAMTVTIYYTE